MYRVYLRDLSGQIVGVASHPRTPAQARQAFAALVGQTRYDGLALAAVLLEQNRVLAVHRFDRTDGDQQYWRGRLDQLGFTTVH